MVEKKFDDIFSRLDTIDECDRRTDRRTGTQRRLVPRIRIASRGKKSVCKYLPDNKSLPVSTATPGLVKLLYAVAACNKTVVREKEIY